MGRKIKDIKGRRSGRLVALEATDQRYLNNGCVLWRCKCDCGNTCIVNGNLLYYGHVKSCGCARNYRRTK